MALSRRAALLAAEIKQHDWSDAPYRIDRAGHQNGHDRELARQLSKEETDNVRWNVMQVASQALGYDDPNHDPFEFAEACGVDTRTRAGRPRSGGITAGLRTRHHPDGTVEWQRPGTYEFDSDHSGRS